MNRVGIAQEWIVDENRRCHKLAPSVRPSAGVLSVMAIFRQLTRTFRRNCLGSKLLRAAEGGRSGVALIAELPRIEAYDDLVRGELKYAMSASISAPRPHLIAILNVRRGTFSGVQRL
jgi:hypothetical protein